MAGGLFVKRVATSVSPNFKLQVLYVHIGTSTWQKYEGFRKLESAPYNTEALFRFTSPEQIVALGTEDEHASIA